MTLSDIYKTYTRGSTGFVIAVETYCGFNISRDEIKRIADAAPGYERFTEIWEAETWWTDDKNAAAADKGQ